MAGKGPMNVSLDRAKDSKGTIKRLMKYLENHKKGFVIVIIFIILYVIGYVLRTSIFSGVSFCIT